MGGKSVEPWKTKFSSARNKGTGLHQLSHPSPSQNSKGNQFLSLNLLAPRKHPTLCFCGSIPLKGLLTSFLVLQDPSNRGPLTMAKRADPAPPTPVHLVDPPQLICQIPSKQHHKPGMCKRPRQGPHHSTVSPAPKRGEVKVHTSLTVAQQWAGDRHQV